MEATTRNPETEPIDVVPAARETALIAAPQDYFLAPIFAATKQCGPREVTVRVSMEDAVIERRYYMGGFHPLRPSHPPPALDVRHGRALFALLSFRDPYEENRLVRFSFNDLCRKYARTNGGRYARAIREILADLTDSYIRVVDLKTNTAHTYRLIESLDIEDRPIRRRDSTLALSSQREMWLNGCTLSPEFYSLLTRVAELQYLKLDVFTSIRSPLAQAIYLYIPSRAHHHSKEQPFEITITKLLEQVSFPVPRFKSARHHLFTQNTNSVISQLDGKETLTGFFRVELAETADQSDWKLRAWVERKPKIQLNMEQSKLLAAYLSSGRPREFFNEALKRIEPLSDYEIQLLELGKVEVAGNRRFFEMVKALLGNTRFAGIVAEAKGDELEGRKAKKNPTARLIHRLMEAVAAAPGSSAPSLKPDKNLKNKVS